MFIKEISGKKIAEIIEQKIKKEFAALKQQLNYIPKLSILMMSDDIPSTTWINIKQRKAQSLGFDSEIVILDKEVSFDEIKATITDLNQDPTVNGILVQLPLYENLIPLKNQILNLVDPKKDIDGLTPYNQGKINFDLPNLNSATALAVYEALNFAIDETNYNPGAKIDLKGKHVVIVNHSVLIGRPLSQMLLNAGATVTVCHEFTSGLTNLTQQADIVVAATGKIGLLSAKDIKQGAIIIDVTSFKQNDGSFKGDFIFDEELISKVAKFTPVPGGIGPITIACLMSNLLTATKLAHEKVSNF